MGFKVKKTEVHFGAKLYEQLRRPDNRFNEFLPNLYAKTPSNGIHYCIRYIDTNTTEETEECEPLNAGQNNNENSVKPVMVLLHGTPGSITDFHEFCQEFGQKYRLIIPEFPDFEFTRNSGHFWHSNEERSELIVSFLNKLSLKTIDCLVCHSGGNPVGLQMISGEIDGEVEVKSLVMLTPPGVKWLSEYQLKWTRKMCTVLASRWRLTLHRLLIPDWVKPFFGVPKTLLKNCTKDELHAMTMVATMSEGPTLLKNYERLSAKRIPTLFVIGEKDNLFPKWKFFKTLELMSANREELFTYIDSDGSTESEAMAKDWIQVLDFRSGGHFCFIKYSKVFQNYFKKFYETLELTFNIKH